jgi:hypothetical protein
VKERVVKLFTSVKSIVTIILTLVFAYLAVTGRISGMEFMTVFTVIVAFYYGTQHEKQNTEAGGQK